jgi:hypothetical protein
MSTTNKIAHRLLATLGLPKPVPALLVVAQNIQKKMTGNPSFPTPIPTLAEFGTAIADLQSAETLALGRAKGAVTLRNEKRTVVVGMIQQLRTYVQSVADLDGTNAASIITSAGFAVRKTPTRTARVFHAAPGPVSGAAAIVAPSAGRRASYEWQYSTDGGKTWLTLPPTLQAKTSIAGLTPGSSAEFKYRAVTKTGADDWSTAVSLTVQ